MNRWKWPLLLGLPPSLLLLLEAHMARLLATDGRAPLVDTPMVLLGFDITLAATVASRAACGDS